MKRSGIAAAAGAALVIVVAVWYLGFWRPEASRLQAARASEAQAAQQVSFDQLQLTSLKAEQPQVAREKGVLKQLVQDIPDGPSLDQLLNTVNAAGKSAGVTVSAVGTPQPSGWGALGAPSSASTGGPSTINVSVTINGDKAQVMKFITTLDHQPRIYVVTAFSVAPHAAAGNSSTNSTSLNVEAFYETAKSQNPTFPGT